MLNPEQPQPQLPEFEPSVLGQVMLDLMELRATDLPGYGQLLRSHWDHSSSGVRKQALQEMNEALREISPDRQATIAEKGAFWKGFMLRQILDNAENMQIDLTTSMAAAELGHL
jgi:hypothetical protein